MRADPKSVKKTDNLTISFALSRSAHAEAARKILIKLTTDVKNILLLLTIKHCQNITGGGQKSATIVSLFI